MEFSFSPFLTAWSQTLTAVSINLFSLAVHFLFLGMLFSFLHPDALTPSLADLYLSLQQHS